MAPVGKVSPDERKSAMRHAVSYNVPCDVWVMVGSAPVRTKSRFLTLTRGTKGADVILEAPVAEGAIMPVRAGDQVEVFFDAGNERYTYAARIIERAKFQLNGGSEVRAIRTTYPAHMLRGQKRNYYRVPMSYTRPIELQYGLIDRYTPDPVNNPRIRQRGRIDLYDLSGGGLSFETPARNSVTLRSGDRLDCAFQLPTNDKVRLYARIVGTRKDHGRATVRYGAEFVDLHRRLQYKQDRDQILRYVADYQQKELAKRSGMHA